MSSTLQRRHGGHGVGVVRCSDHNRVNVSLVEEAAKVVVRFGSRIFLFRGIQVAVVDVAERDNVFTADFFEIVPCAVGYADHADVEPCTR